MKKQQGSILVTTLICFSIISTLCLGCISLIYTNNEISSVNYKSTVANHIVSGGFEIVYSKILEETNKAIDICNISEDKKQTFIDYFLGNNKYDFIIDIENIKFEGIDVNIVNDKIYIEDDYIKLDITCKKTMNDIKKSARCSFKIDTNIDYNENESNNLVTKYNYREI